MTRPTLARSSLWIGVGQVVRVGVQAVYFVLIARSLGAREFGAYVGVLALVAIAAPFASLGTGNLLVKHVSRAPDTFPRHWGRALAVTLLTGTGLLAIVSVGARLWLPSDVPLLLVLLVGAADLIFVRLADVSAMAFQAHHQMSRTALVHLLLGPVRLAAALVLLATTPHPTAVQWGGVYLLGAVVGGVAAVLLVTRELGKPAVKAGQLTEELGEGTFFATTLAAQTTTNDIDKALLARLSTLDATGVYGAAYRLVDMAFLPVGAVLVATYPRFFERGAEGVRATAAYARRLVAAGLAYGVVAGVGLYVLAPLVPLVLGRQYPETVTAIRWLAILPLLKVIHYFGADALTGAGHQGLRTALLVSVALLNVLLNLWLIPLYSWRGAAAASLLSDGLFGVAIWGALWYLGRRELPQRAPGSAAPAKAG